MKLYSIAELAEILKLHQKTILRFIHEGRIEGRKIGRTWMVSEEELKRYCHGELSSKATVTETPDYSSIGKRITVSAVVEISEQNSEEASRISNSLMAMLNSEKSANNVRFDSFYYPEIQKSRYVFYGSAKMVSEILQVVNQISGSEYEYKRV